jgi:hypothetical protein
MRFGIPAIPICIVQLFVLAAAVLLRCRSESGLGNSKSGLETAKFRSQEESRTDARVLPRPLCAQPISFVHGLPKSPR